MKIGIIGLGLIGGSMGLDFRAHWTVREVLGMDVDTKHEDTARRMNLVDRIVDQSTMLEKADVIVVSVPVDASTKLISELLSQLRKGQVVLDVGSSKVAICEAVASCQGRSQFVAAHPIAGTENSGPQSAVKDLFRGKIGILCRDKSNSGQVLSQAREIFELLGMKVVMMSAEEHDKHLAYVSHLSHVSSFALGKTVLEIEKDEQTIFDLAGSGFDSTVRLAKSSPAMWSPIFEHNASNILSALSEYIDHLNNFKVLLEKRNMSAIEDFMIEANDVRRVLNR